MTRTAIALALLLVALAAPLEGCASAERFAVRVSKCVIRELPELLDGALPDVVPEGVAVPVDVELTRAEIQRLRRAGFLVSE